MPRPSRLLLVFLTSLAVGAGSGWIGSRQTAGAEVTESTDAPARATAPARPQWTKPELVAAAAKFSIAVMSGSLNPYTHLLADWTDDEVRLALEESLRTPECVIEGGGRIGLPGMLLRAWMDRDLDAATAWFESLKTSDQSELFGTLSHHWPEARAAEGLELFLRLNQNLSSISGWSIISKSLRQQAAIGPEAVGSLLGRLLDQNVGLQFGNALGLPADFDYAALAQHEAFSRLPESGLAQSLLSGWAQQDRDGLFSWISREGKWKQVNALLADPMTSKPEHLAWLAGRIAKLDETAQETLLENLNYRQVEPTTLATLAEAFQDPALSGQIKRVGIRSIFNGDVRRVMPLLESIPDPAQRVEMLAALSAPIPSGIIGRFDDADAKILTEKLREWGADEAKAAAIVDHIRKPAADLEP